MVYTEDLRLIIGGKVGRGSTAGSPLGCLRDSILRRTMPLFTKEKCCRYHELTIGSEGGIVSSIDGRKPCLFAKEDRPNWTAMWRNSQRKSLS